MRSLVRRIIGPLVRWAAKGHEARFYSVRGPDGAFLCFCDPFGVVYETRMDLITARDLADAILDDAYNAAEGLPLPPRDQ